LTVTGAKNFKNLGGELWEEIKQLFGSKARVHKKYGGGGLVCLKGDLRNIKAAQVSGAMNEKHQEPRKGLGGRRKE